jgi:hypothetical protein
VTLLIATVHRIGARAERKVTEELINAFRRVTGKENILFAIAEASLARPADAVREVIYPAVSGGEQTLRQLVHEYKTKGPVYRRTVQTTLKASYTNHYRKGLIDLLDVLEFRSTNTAHQPVIEALKLIARCARAGNLTYYPAGETVVIRSCRDRDSRSSDGTTRVSPAAMKARHAVSSGRSVSRPDCFSAKMRRQPTARRASSWRSSF